jgi:hypothetical protein
MDKMTPRELGERMWYGLVSIRGSARTLAMHPNYDAWRTALEELRVRQGMHKPITWGDSSSRDAEALARAGVDPEQIWAVYVLCFGTNPEG